MDPIRPVDERPVAVPMVLPLLPPGEREQHRREREDRRRARDPRQPGDPGPAARRPDGAPRVDVRA